jgi:hypothetical protein
MWHSILTKYHEDWYRCSSNIKVLPKNLNGCSAGIIDGRDSLNRRLYGLRWHDIHTKFHEDS